MDLICTDCALWAANRDDSGAADDWRGHDAAAGYILGGPAGFSWSPCDSCGSRLGGDRYAAELPD